MVTLLLVLLDFWVVRRAVLVGLVTADLTQGNPRARGQTARFLEDAKRGLSARFHSFQGSRLRNALDVRELSSTRTSRWNETQTQGMACELSSFMPPFGDA